MEGGTPIPFLQVVYEATDDIWLYDMDLLQWCDDQQMKLSLLKRSSPSVPIHRPLRESLINDKQSGKTGSGPRPIQGELIGSDAARTV